MDAPACPHWAWLLATVLASALLAWLASQPPPALPADAPADAFSATRAMADVRVIAARPHPTGSAENDAVRAYLAGRLQSLGFSVREQPFALTAKQTSRLAKRGSAPARTGVNLIAVRAGPPASGPAVALMAHYDSVTGSPGAADDAFGVAAALEIARAIPRDAQRRDLAIVLTDAEEIGLAGARAFFAAAPAGDPLAARIGTVVNLEARGGGGRAIMFQASPGNGALVDLFARVVRQPAANSLAVSIYERLPNSTDFTEALQRGVPGFNFAPIGDARLYHSPLATPDNVDPRSLQHLGSQALDLARALSGEAALPPAGADAVFSDVLGLATVAYAPWVGWALLALAAGLVVAIARRRRGEWTARGVALAAAHGLAGLVAAALALTALNALSRGPGAPDYYDRLAALPRLEWQALLVLLAVLAAMVALARRGGLERWLGLAGVVLLLATAVQAALPGGSPFFTWPLLLASAVVAAASSRPRPDGAASWALFAAAAVVGIGFLAALGHFAMLSIGTGLPAVLVVLLAPAWLLLAPLLPRPHRGFWWLALALLLAAVAMALWVRLDPVAASVPVYSETR
jgi:hypothetical protein